MASMRDIKRRIKSVNSTQQITKAMNLVAASKLQKAKSRQRETKPYFSQTQRVIASVVNNSKGIKHPYLIQRDGKKSAVIILTSDRGLCGGYNSNISKEVFNFINERNDSTLITVGSKGRDYFRRRSASILESFVGISEKPQYEDAARIGQIILDLYKNGEVDEVHLAYTEFETTISHIPTITRILPVDTSSFEEEEEDEKSSHSVMRYEPNEEEVLDFLIPKYINTVIYGALVESATCEQAARMTSMDSATENADGMISTLNLYYNRARQGAITQEITEIVSGANALK